jgi:hypothetical protein
MDIFKNVESAEKFFNETMEGAWKQYKEEVIDNMPGMTDTIKSFLQTTFNRGYQGGLAILSTYMMSAMLQSHLETLVGKSLSPIQKNNIDDLFKNFKDQPNNGNSNISMN